MMPTMERPHYVTRPVDTIPVTDELLAAFARRDLTHCEVLDHKGAFVCYDFDMLADEAEKVLKDLPEDARPFPKSVVNAFLKVIDDKAGEGIKG